MRPTHVGSSDLLLLPKKEMGVGGVGNPRAVRVFQAACGRVLCVHRRGTVHALCTGAAREAADRIVSGCLRDRLRGATPRVWARARVIRTFPAVRVIERRGRRRNAPRSPPCASRPVQLRDPSSLTSDAYLAQRAWQRASLAGCPRHPGGGCGFARHGTYPRQTPAGMRITRYYCPTTHETFSLLPDCLASRFPGDLDDLERVVAHVETARSIETAADVLRPDIVLPSAVRWVRRRLTLIRATLLAVVTLLPDLFGGDAHLRAVRAALATDHALVTLRAQAAPLLSALPRPLGFGPRLGSRRAPSGRRQHDLGADLAAPSG